MQQQDEYKELLELARAVVPKTWNVYEYCDIHKHKTERGILNIEILRYSNESFWEGDSPAQILKARGTAEYIRYRDHNGKTRIDIHCSHVEDEQFVLLHELAHIAVNRLASFVTKAFKSDVGFAEWRSIEADMHGIIFLAMLNIFRNRAIKNGYTMFADYEIEEEGRFIDEYGNEH